MKKVILSPAPNPREAVWGRRYLLFQLCFLSSLLQAAFFWLGLPISAAELNLTYHGISFFAVIWIFHDFLRKNLAQFRRHLIAFVQAAVLGLAAYFASTWLIERLIGWLAPGFANANDAFITQMASTSYYLMVVATVILAPLAEECLYRGLLFRGLYGRSRVLAYCVSVSVFAAVHIVGYFGTYSAPELLLSFLQYLPGGLWLAWSYEKSGTIIAPIFIHSVINAVAMYTIR